MVRDGDEPMGVVETQAGTVVGTPRYMSPEQAQGKPLDARTDLYSLGVILYQMLTGRPPFTDNDAVVVMARHIKSVPKRPNEANPEANVPKELEDVIMRLLSKDPADRQSSAEALTQELLAAIEAQGAMNSGVRASIANAASIAVPESMKPPAALAPVVVPKRADRGVPKSLFFLIPLVVGVAGAGGYLGLRSNVKPPVAEVLPSSASTSATVTASAEPPSTATAAQPSATIVATPATDLPPSTAESRPPAQPTVPPKGHTPTKTPLRTPKTAAAPPTSAPRAPASPPPTPSATSTYGVFDQ
jgi:serine/threonine-protein kinase